MYALALKYENEGDDEQALKALDEATAIDPKLVRAYLNAAYLCYGLGKEDRAKQYLQSAKRYAEGNDEAFKLKMSALQDSLNGETENALQTYELLVRSHPDDIEGQSQFADVAMEKGRLEEAKRALDICLKAEPNNTGCYYSLMRLQIYKNQFDEALNTYEAFRKRGLNYAWFDELAGVALWGNDKLDEAEGKLKGLGKSQKSRVHGAIHGATAKEWLANIRFYQGRIREARGYLGQLADSAENANEGSDYLLEIAQTEALIGENQDAREVALKVVSRSTDPLTHINAAKVLASVGASKEADTTLTSPMSNGKPVGKLGSSNTHLIKGFTRLGRSQTADGISELNAAYEVDGDLEVGYALARAYAEAGKCDRAIPLLTKVIDSKGAILLEEPTVIWPLAHYRLALCYDKTGQRQAAITTYSKFLDLWKLADPDLPFLSRARERLAYLRKHS